MNNSDRRLVAALALYLLGAVFSFGHAQVHLAESDMKTWDVCMSTLLWPFYLSWQVQLGNLFHAC